MKSMKVCVLSLALFIGLSQSHQCPDSGSASASSSEEMMMSGESEEMMMSGESGEMMMSEESGESSSSSTEEEEETERRRRGLKMQKCKKKGMTPTKVEELESLENVRNFRKCIRKCNKNEDCEAWRFCKETKTCELFSSFESFEENEKYIAGSKEDCMKSKSTTTMAPASW